MSFRPGKLLLLLLIPALGYGVVKGFLYYKAKRNVDGMVAAVSSQADVRYADISTDLRGAVTVRGITVQPLGHDDSLHIEAIRVASDDPLFFYHGARWEPGKNTPPPSLSFAIDGIRLPLTTDLLQTGAAAGGNADDSACAQGLQLTPIFLQKIGFSDLDVDIDGHYRLNEAARTLEFGINIDLHDIESLEFVAMMSDVDILGFSQGGGAPPNLAHLSLVAEVSPKFGRQALKECAIGTDETVQVWSERLAGQTLEALRAKGLTLGAGLSDAVREFFRTWGEFKLVSEPEQPIGLLSLMFLPPDQLVDAMALQLSLNDRAIVDTSFDWQRPDAQAPGLSTLFGVEQPQAQGAVAPKQTNRIIVRRQYEPVPLRDIGRYVDQEVQIKPRSQPMREGVLRGIGESGAEVEQTLHGGKFTVYVPLDEIESVRAMFQRRVAPN